MNHFGVFLKYKAITYIYGLPNIPVETDRQRDHDGQRSVVWTVIMSASERKRQRHEDFCSLTGICFDDFPTVF